MLHRLDVAEGREVSDGKFRRGADPSESVFDETVGSKDPTVFTVFLEDSAGFIGTVLAFLGIFLGATLHNPYLDPLASISIGILLAGVALLLGRETGALLIGERANRAIIRKIRKIITEDSAVEKIQEVLTMQLGPGQALLTAKVKFHDELNHQQLESAIHRIKKQIEEKEPMMKKIFIEPDSSAELEKGINRRDDRKAG